MLRSISVRLLIVWVFSSIGFSQEQASKPDLSQRLAMLESLVDRLQKRVTSLEAELATRSSVLAADGSPEESPATPGQDQRQPSSLQMYWRDGIRADSPSRRFQIQMGGRIMNDWAFMSEEQGIRDRLGNLQDGTEFRRARLYFSGHLYDHVEFLAEYDFAGGDADFRDVYLGLVDVPFFGGIRMGQFKEPFSLEQSTSSQDISFMERSLADVFAPSRHTGVMLHNRLLEERVSWAAGIFRGADSFGNHQGDGEYNLTTRLTALPWYADEGRRLLHLGFGYSRRSPSDDLLRLSQRPEAGLAPTFVDTGDLAVESADLFGVEGALVYGPASVQSEYMRSSAHSLSGPDVNFSGFYVQGSYFLTGEYRRYDQEEAGFTRVRPRRNLFGGRRAPGAWEIGARYSFLDLNDGAVQGGRVDDFTLGLNWYWNPNSRVMWNYIFSDLDSVGTANILQMRFQVDF